MPRPLHKLAAGRLKTIAPGKYSDGGGLWFFKPRETGGQWVFRYTMLGKRHEMGLGAYPEVSLAMARDMAEEHRRTVRAEADPMKLRAKQRREAERRLHLLKDIALDAFESRKAELKGDGKAGRWLSPLQIHVLPKLGKRPISEIDQTEIRDTLAPIWHDKADTARKAMNRLSICFKHAAALGLDVDLQATDKARALLGKQRHTAQNIPALPWADVPAFYQSLSEGGVTELALRLLILTAVRSQAVRFCHLDQIEGDIWTVPADHMKGRKGVTKDFRVPLSAEALAVIDAAKPFACDGFLFPGTRKGVISDMTMTGLMKRRDMVERPHGFRSSFRDWVAETTNTPHDVAETALGHTVGGSVERAYRRTDFLEQRRALMERWANHVSASREEKVVLLNG